MNSRCQEQLAASRHSTTRNDAFMNTQPIRQKIHEARQTLYFQRTGMEHRQMNIELYEVNTSTATATPKEMTSIGRHGHGVYSDVRKLKKDLDLNQDVIFS